ncbi:MAG: putative bifunctional diguanylate cyclase/phosphodiesterase [Solirubrobacteraceae bacterium]
MVAGAILVVGLAVSVASGLMWRSSVSTHDRQTFDGSASGVTATLDTLLRRDADFVATLRAVLTLQPHMSATRFDEWFAELQGQQRLVGSLGASVVERVPAGALKTFQARRDADPAFRALVGGTPQRVPLASSGHDCLLAAGVTVSGTLNKANTQETQGNWCSDSGIGVFQSRFLQAQTDTGQLLVQSLTTQGRHLVILQAAFYRRGASLATVAGRRAAVAGWILSTFDIPAAIQLALEDHPGLGVALYHSNPGQRAEVIDQVGRGATGAAYTRSDTVQIEGAWTVKVSGAGIADGPSAGVQGLLVFVLGALVSALICALILVLARSRERALGMVHEKTGQLRHQALHDALTGLPNRVLALDRAQQMLARARRQQTAVAALYVDLDGFKHVNDTFGHAAGDELLRVVAARLLTIVREGDTAARLGGDEFVVLLEGALVDLAPELVAERLLEVLRQPYELSDALGRQLSVTASVGIAVGPRLNADELLRDADLALYQAKACGRNRFSLFESSMQTASHERLTLEMDLAEALERQQLFLLYQPTFDLQSETVIGVEALIRWRHPMRGVLAPEKFIPIAEQCGLIVPIGRWVLEEACRQAAIWHGHGHQIGMSVNVSARQLDDDTLIDDVHRALQENAMDPAALTLEVTETALMRDPEATAARLRLLKQLGVRISIDDFGTGYSSLAYLRQFPADALKIDRSFIDGIATSEGSAALIHTLVQLGKTLDIETLAEGIEDQDQLDTLQREHCDHGQGFLFSRPLDADAVELFLSSARPGTAALATSR